MEKYDRRMGGFEAQGNIDIAHCGCGRHTHRFVMVACEEECGEQGYRVIFRTETCNGYYYEFTGYVRKVQAAPPCAQHCGNLQNDRRIDDRTDCGTAAAVWPACGNQQSNGCACNRQAGAFTYEAIRREQKNPSLWENWLNRGQDHHL